MKYIFSFLFVLMTVWSRADHIMGGEITWSCSGSGYVFELVLYRNCTGAEVNTVSDVIKVWNHPSVTSITMNFISRQDISPSCTQVTGGPVPLLCGTGANGGNGTGAVEKIIYRSGITPLPGTAPAAGWIFTYEPAGLRSTVTNLTNPNAQGLTVISKMYPIPGGTAGVCSDNSPKFEQYPYMVICSGEDFNYASDVVDVDLDSLSSVFSQPWGEMSGGAYAAGVNPPAISFEPGFSITSPTPDASFQPGNIAASLNASTGEISFLSQTIGIFVTKTMVQSYRSGVLIAEVEREIQVLVQNCPVTGAGNNAPSVAGPFAGSFTTTVDAGTLVNFTISSSDVEVMQDGSPQNNILNASGLMFGTGFTSSGCINAPCATLTPGPPVTMTQGVSTDFSWQTACVHTQTPFGTTQEITPYHFVFKFADNYCQVPKVTFRTVTINVRNPGILPAAQINCISTDASGNVTVTWDPVSDPNGTFQQLELYSVQNGLIGSFTTATNSAVITNPGQELDFYTVVVSGCNGNSQAYSDTVSNVFLTLLNQNDGRARLEWNSPAPTIPAGMSSTADIEREYPAGTWTIVGTVPYGTELFLDTIDICQAFLNYRVVYHTPSCDWTSNTEGDIFKDLLTPDIPVINSASIDTTTGNVTITWNQNYQPDTYGYVIYWKDANGFIVEIDTVYGIGSTSYTQQYHPDGPTTYSVAAFDSCYTNTTPVTHQTSAKANIHTTMFLKSVPDVCENTAMLSWSSYLGWADHADSYTVFGKKFGGSWVNYGSLSGNSMSVQLEALSSYIFTIQASNSSGQTAFSNLDTIVLTGPTAPSVNYLRVATVTDNSVTIRYQVETGSNVQAVLLQRFNPRINGWDDVATLPANSPVLSYTDADVDVHQFSYRYRGFVMDSCGNTGAMSNYANTILLKIQADNATQINYLTWSPYSVFDGSVVDYDIYRGIDDVFSPNAIVSLPPTQRFFEDDVSGLGSQTGRFCYYIVAVEGMNQYGFRETAASNQECASIAPLVYIPNAFTPDGVNPVFLPVVSFVEINSYDLIIYDRWGQPIFETKDPAEGWNGIHPMSGKLVEFGMYGYLLRVTDGNFRELEYRGNVTVVR